jgi:acyl carrier protein
MSSAETLSRVKRVIGTCLKVDERVVFADDMPLVGGEYDLDSLDILLIVTELEKEFGVAIRDGQMNKAAFTSVSTLARFIEGLPRAE